SLVGRSSSDPPASQPAQRASTTWRWKGESGRVSAGGPVWSAVVTSGSTIDAGAEKTTLSAPSPTRSPWRRGTFTPGWRRLPFRYVPLKLPRSSTNQRSPSSVTSAWWRLTVGFSTVRSLSSARPIVSSPSSSRSLPSERIRLALAATGELVPPSSSASLQRRGGDANHPCDPGRQPPVVAAHDRHRRRHHHRADERRVEEDRDGETAAELLEADDAPGQEPGERRDHDHGGRGHDPPRALEADRHGPAVLSGLVPGLAHPADEEDLVVHREAEEHREEEDRDPAFDLRELVEAEHVVADSEPEDHDEDAVAGRDRDQVEEDRLQRQQQGPERPHQQEVRQREHADHQPRERVVRPLEEVDALRRSAAGLHVHAGGE